MMRDLKKESRNTITALDKFFAGHVDWIVIST